MTKSIVVNLLYLSNFHYIKFFKTLKRVIKNIYLYALFAIIKIFSYNYTLKDDLEFHLWLDFYC